MGGLVERLDDIPRPAWIALVVLGFIVFWPVGLALLIYLKWSGRMFGFIAVATVTGPRPKVATPVTPRAKSGAR